MDTFDRFELPAVFSVLDALQMRTDRSIRSRESMEPSTTPEVEAALLRTFGTPAITNKTMDAILKEAHLNLIAVAKSTIVPEPVCLPPLL